MSKNEATIGFRGYFSYFARNVRKLTIILLLVSSSAFAQFTVQTKVECVIDGDTFITTINNKQESIRMKCIDAPELKQTFIGFNKRQQNIGIEARKHLTHILKQQNNIITLKCNNERDKYNRLTCSVFDNNHNNINIQMIQEGYAYALPSYCFSKFDSMKYLTHQQLARFSQTGLWQYGAWDEPSGWR